MPGGGRASWKAKLYTAFKSAIDAFLRDPRKPIAFAGLVAVGMQVYPYVKDAAIMARSSYLDLRHNLHYVERPALESHIADIAEKKGRYYCVVYGHHGSGKSDIIDRYAMGRKDVIKVSVDCTKPSNSARASLSMKLLGLADPKVDIDDLQMAVSQSMTIIFDVEYGGNQDGVVQAVQYLAEKLAPYCRCIVVLSEAYTIGHFYRDALGSRCIYIGEMTNQEAKQLVDRLLEREAGRHSSSAMKSCSTSSTPLGPIPCC
jgi:hypothetical protein